MRPRSDLLVVLHYVQVFEVINPVTNTTTLQRNLTWFGSLSAYSIGYKYANQTLFTFLPLVLLLVFNTLLVRQVRRPSVDMSIRNIKLIFTISSSAVADIAAFLIISCSIIMLTNNIGRRN